MANQNFADIDIAEVFGLGSIPEDKKQEMISKITELIQKRIMIQVLQRLSAEDQTELSKMEQDSVKIIEFFVQKIPNFENVVKEEVEKLKNEIGGATEV